MNKNVLIVAGILVVVVGGGIAGTAYMAASSKTVSIDKAQIEAPVVKLSPTHAGLLRHTYVTEGQIIPAGTVVAQVGVELIKATQGGLVLSVRTDLGSALTPQDAVVTMVDPSLLRVVGQVQEDKGLASIAVGDVATFTVDAFGGTKFDGVVSEVSPVSNQGDVVFSISDKRQLQDFDIKVRFDTALHPELRQGMSAKLSIYKQ